MGSDRHANAVLYSEKLLGLKDDCDLPYCPEWERSTGWLLYHVKPECWFIELECPIHGCGGTWKPEWQALIDEVLEIKAREGFGIAAALQALRDERERQSE